MIFNPSCSNPTPLGYRKSKGCPQNGVETAQSCTNTFSVFRTEDEGAEWFAKWERLQRWRIRTGRPLRKPSPREATLLEAGERLYYARQARRAEAYQRWIDEQWERQRVPGALPTKDHPEGEAVRREVEALADRCEPCTPKS